MTKLVLWLHLLFVAFTIGPVTVAIMSTPRYIRQRDVRIVRYLSRTTFIFALASLGVLIAGEALASLISVASKPWVIVSATLFIVALALLALILRDQRKAIKALEEAALAVTTAGTAPATTADLPPAADDETDSQAGDDIPAASPAPGAASAAAQIASVERGRIAMMAGLVGLIWLIILVLMVWH
jgi:hypothetical protein